MIDNQASHLAAMEAHDAAVKTIATHVRSFYERQKAFRIYHGSTNSTRTSQRRADNTINTSSLNHVLSIDKTTMTAMVEPNVPMDDLVNATLKHGLIPPVVMEFPGITVGGGFSGTSGESSSFRYGAFDSTFDSIEIVLPDGTIAKASKKERNDLFWGAASAFGTLGVVTLLEVRLLPAKKFVRLQYEISTSVEDSVKKIRTECDDSDNDFVDGIVFDKHTTLVCTGRLVDEVPEGEKVRRFTRRSDPWFYIRAREVQNTLKKADGKSESAVVDHVPLVDYLFRYDRGGFWVGKYSFSYFLVPFNRITRFLLDRFMHTRVMYRAVHKSGLADYYMVQDVGVPFSRTAEFQTWLDDTFNIYPLWLCPLRIRREDPDSSYGLHSEFSKADTPDLMNFGVWGPVKGSRREVVEMNRALERKVQELAGKKWLYAHAYYTEEEFWAHYDRGSYDALREKYKATFLPSVYDKVKVDVDREEEERNKDWRTRGRAMLGDVWPLRGLKGFLGAARGGDYLMRKKGKHVES
ncbi:FAD binding domain-containing protein [Pochonia chlamydosporia 170]|uniref:Delta(24)-sterol reductase n=1 Tax=Pochonia chlamydosporia 170 TaxID=1380566 RepID=A0A179FJE2_METCM|nr:FAD binding domain-containing protein [Pochonia chlamydosporia 170]OAQ65143.1 FAD binding domain-containing protein [Pochonia chlamydosporia 170]